MIDATRSAKSASPANVARPSTWVCSGHGTGRRRNRGTSRWAWRRCRRSLRGSPRRRSRTAFRFSGSHPARSVSVNCCISKRNSCCIRASVAAMSNRHVTKVTRPSAVNTSNSTHPMIRVRAADGSMRSANRRRAVPGPASAWDRCCSRCGRLRHRGPHHRRLCRLHLYGGPHRRSSRSDRRLPVAVPERR